MSKKKETIPPNRDVELIAIWLHGACRGNITELRKLIRIASQDAAEIYSVPEDNNADGKEPEDSYRIRELLGRFAAEIDRLQRDWEEDQKDE